MASNTDLVERLLRQSVLLHGQTTISFSKTLSTEGLLILTIDENAGARIVVKISEVREISQEEADPNWKHKSVDQDLLKRLLDNSIMAITRETLKVQKSIKLDGLIAYKVDDCRYYVVKLGHKVKSSTQDQKGKPSARGQRMVNTQKKINKHKELHANTEHKILNVYEHGTREVGTSKHAKEIITLKNVGKAKACPPKDLSNSKETILIYQRNLSPAEEETSAASVNRAHNVNNNRVTLVDGANNVTDHPVTSGNGASNVINHRVTSGNGANNDNYQGVAGTSMRIDMTNTADQIFPEVLNALGMDINAINTRKLSATSSEPESQRMTNVVNTLLAPLNSFGVDYYQEKGLKIYEELNIRCAKCNYVCENIGLLENHNSIEHQLSTCFVCTRTVQNKHNLKRHVQQHLEPRLECQLCNRKFHDKGNLKRHVMSHANKPLNSPGVKRNKCTFPAKPKTENGKRKPCTFTVSELAYMNRAAKKGTRRECCNQHFVHPMKYKLHMKNHSGNKSVSFRCFFCEYTLPTFEKFSLHQRTHMKISPQQSFVRKGLQKRGTEPSLSTKVPTTTSKKVGSVVIKNKNQTETANSCMKATLSNSKTLQQGVMSRSKPLKTITANNVAFKSKLHPVYTEETQIRDLSYKENTLDALKQFSGPAVTTQHKYPQFKTDINLSQNVFDRTLVGNATVKQNITDMAGNGGRERLPQVVNYSERVDYISDEMEEDTASCGFCMISFTSSKYLEVHLKENPSHKL